MEARLHSSIDDLPQVSDRFELMRRLGTGATGVVYLAQDRSRKIKVALKTLKHLDGSRLYRFKKEFRSLSDLSHPNLIELYELFSDGRTWYFTMEYIDGVSFLDWVRPDIREQQEEAARDRADSVPSNGVPGPRDTLPAIRLTPSPAPRNLSLALRAFFQLADGILALHAAGKLHRDIKPSNVLVDVDGRVFILDFGLTTDVGERDMTRDGTVLGTVAYMAPEQMEAEELTEASDMFSVGVILYRTLTGRLPYCGRFHEILLDKRRGNATPPIELFPNIPEDLSNLSISLMDPEPEKRPTGQQVQEILKALAADAGQPLTETSVRSIGGDSESSFSGQSFLGMPGRMRGGSTGTTDCPIGPESASPGPTGGWSAEESLDATGSMPFVGRHEQLEILKAGYNRGKDAGAYVAFVSGRSGMGKSVLVRKFVEGIADKGLVYLSGRCYERESVPYKAFDDLVDNLARYLRRRPRRQVEILLPRNAFALTRLFPVLGEVSAIADAVLRSPIVPDPIEIRRRGFSALRDLLGRLADRTRLILHIDDLQWGDSDSVALLTEILRPPDTPPLMLIAGYRSENEDDEGPIRAFRAAAEEFKGHVHVHDVRLEALKDAEVHQLVAALVDSEDSVVQGRAAAIVRESAGHPYFVYELVRALQAGDSGPGSTSPQAVTLDGALGRRIDGLPQPAQVLLRVIAVSGRPIPRPVAALASGLGKGEYPALQHLRRAHLIRTGGSGDRAVTDTYHDRVRETVLARTDPDLIKTLHGQLADALTSAGTVDPELLFTHLDGAGRDEQAGLCAVKAAAQATKTLAFGRSAQLLQRALELRPVTGAEAAELHAALGDALANDGRGPAAGAAFLVAAEHRAEDDELGALELRRRAAEQLLFSGHLEEGLKVLRDVLGALGMKMAVTPRAKLMSIVWQMVRLRIRGLKFKEKAEADVPPRKLLAIDTCRSVTIGLHLVDPLTAVDFQKRQLLLALDVGEPFRIVRALAAAACSAAFEGRKGADEAHRLARTSLELSDRIQRPSAQGIARYGAGFASFLLTEWDRAFAYCDEAVRIFQERCERVVSDLSRARQLRAGCFLYLGRIRELRTDLDQLLAIAQDRGDRYGETFCLTRLGPLAWLAGDEPDRAMREIELAERGWTTEGFLQQHYYFLEARTLIDLYRGAGRSAWERVEGTWPRVKGSLILRAQLGRSELFTTRARAALGAAHAGTDPDRLLQMAEKDARKILGEGNPFTGGLARQQLAGVESMRGRSAEAVVHLRGSITDFTGAGMPMHIAVSRMRLGKLLGGDEGKRLLVEADEWMQSEGIVEPARVAAMLAPGFD
jgi:serine/threonine protein kinase/tetratricopeptide (TPR) repeat protein